MSEDLFAPTTVEYDPNSNYLDQLVGEGKKFTDPNKLAYSALEKDRFIERLKSENEAMRKSVNSSQKLEELVNKLSTTTKAPSSNDDNHNSELGDTKAPTVPVPGGLTVEQAEALVHKKLTEKDNFSKAIEGIKRSYGTDYQTKLDTEAKNLGLTATEVNSLAKSNPELFLRIFQGNTPTDDYITPPSGINANSLSPSNTLNGIRTEKYYKDLKAADPKKYWSKAIQNQEYKDAMQLGEKFFNA